jgi:hypothetical protein
LKGLQAAEVSADPLALHFSSTIPKHRYGKGDCQSWLPNGHHWAVSGASAGELILGAYNTLTYIAMDIFTIVIIFIADSIATGVNPLNTVAQKCDRTW